MQRKTRNNVYYYMLLINYVSEFIYTLLGCTKNVSSYCYLTFNSNTFVFIFIYFFKLSIALLCIIIKGKFLSNHFTLIFIFVPGYLRMPKDEANSYNIFEKSQYGTKVAKTAWNIKHAFPLEMTSGNTVERWFKKILNLERILKKKRVVVEIL